MHRSVESEADKAQESNHSLSLQAGLASPANPSQLLIALEPEADSIYCRKLKQRELVPDEDLGSPNMHHHRSNSLVGMKGVLASGAPVSAEFKTGTRYIIVDCGGGTVDLTVHEMEDAGTLKELYKASGGAWGAIGVDKEFENLLIKIFGIDFVVSFKNTKPAGWVDLMIAFEAKKRTASPSKLNPLNISLPFSFIEHYSKLKGQTVEQAIKKFGNKDIKWSTQGMLRVSPAAMHALFDPVMREIVRHIQELLKKPELDGVKFMFLVGGFAESPLLQNEIRKSFSSHLRIVIPHDVGLTILKGAVMFGLDPTVVRVRRQILQPSHLYICFIDGAPKWEALKHNFEHCFNLSPSDVMHQLYTYVYTYDDLNSLRHLSDLLPPAPTTIHTQTRQEK